MGDLQEQIAQRSALFPLKKRAKLRIVPQESENLRCMVLMHLVKKHIKGLLTPFY